MINLLPVEEKTKIAQEKKKTIVLVLWFLALFFTLCLSSILFSLNVYIRSEADSRKMVLSQEQSKFDQSEARVFQEKIGLVNSEIGQLNSFYLQKNYFSKVLEDISSVMPGQLSITEFSAARCEGDGKCAKVAISGKAATREDLYDFKIKLEKDSKFSEIFLPASSWVKPSDVDFSATFKIKE